MEVTMDKVMFVGIIGAALAMLVAWLWVVFNAFQESAAWGFATLLLNPVALVYALLRPERCRKPLILFGVGFVLFLVGLGYARSKDRPPPAHTVHFGATMEPTG